MGFYGRTSAFGPDAEDQVCPVVRTPKAHQSEAMDILALETRQLVEDLRASNPVRDSLERYLLNALDPFLLSLESGGKPQRPSTEALSRFCVEHMDWSSPLYDRCARIVEWALAQL